MTEILGPEYDADQVSLVGSTWDRTDPTAVPEYAMLSPGSIDAFGYPVSIGGPGDVRPLWQQTVDPHDPPNGLVYSSYWAYAAHLPAVDLTGWDAAYLHLEYEWTPTAISPGPLVTNFYAEPWDGLVQQGTDGTLPPPLTYTRFGSTGTQAVLFLFAPDQLAQVQAGNLGAYINTPGVTTITESGVSQDFRYTISIRRCYVQPIRFGPDVRPPLRQRQRSDGLGASGAPRQHQRATLQSSIRQRAIR